MKAIDKNVVYLAIFTPENDNSAINVSFPDVPEALTFGRTKSQAVINAQGALGLSLYGYNKLPKPSTESELRNQLNSNQYLMYIPINLAFEFNKVNNYTNRNNTITSIPKK